MGRRRVLVIVVAVAAAVVAGGVVLSVLVGGAPEQVAAVADPAAGRRHATAACSAFMDVLELVRRDARSDDVLDRLDEGERAATAAADADPAWIDLSGALAGLEVGLREDDAEATRVSVSVARAACGRTLGSS